MASLNQVNLIGRLGKDPELSYTANGKAVARFSLATSEKWKDSDGNAQEKTEWHTVVAWDKLAELIGKHLRKGGLVFIGGKLSTRSWDDKAGGGKRYATEIVASQMQFLESKSKDSGESSAPVAEANDLPF